MSDQKYKQQLHKKALVIAQNYKRCELELIETLEQVDKYKLCYSFGYSSLYSYTADYLGLSKDVAAIFINVARKTRELPVLRQEIKNGNITVSKARRMTSVINSQNQDHWIELAKNCSKAQLEKEVAKVQPQQAVITKTKYVAAELEVKDKAVIKSLEKEVRIQLQVGVSEELMLKLRRVQDVLSQKQRKPVDLENALEVLSELYLQKEDPFKIAQRQKIRGRLNNAKAKKCVPGHNIKQQSRLESSVSFVNQKVEGKKKLVTQKVKVKTESVTQKKKLLKESVNQIVKFKTKSVIQKTLRKPLTAQEKHLVFLKFHGRCGYEDVGGRKCNQQRFLEIHHKKPVAQGGSNDPSNLILLCSGHHKVMHTRE